MQYTLRNIPEDLDRALRRIAEEQHSSLNQVAIEALRRGTGVSRTSQKYRDLADLSGSWVEDPEQSEALEAQRQIDPELWD